jgi:hypothetical protein
MCVFPLLLHARATVNATGRHALQVIAFGILHARTIVNVMGNCAYLNNAFPIVAWTTVRVHHRRYALTIAV